jgi:hypothetical protein
MDGSVGAMERQPATSVTINNSDMQQTGHPLTRNGIII